MIQKYWSNRLVLPFLPMFCLLHKQTKLYSQTKRQKNTSTAMNCIYFLPCFCSDSFDILNKFSCLVYTWFQYLYINSKDRLNYIETPIKNLLSLASEYLAKFYNFYHHLSLKTVFPVLKLAQICCINICEHFFSWKLAI